MCGEFRCLPAGTKELTDGMSDGQRLVPSGLRRNMYPTCERFTLVKLVGFLDRSYRTPDVPTTDRFVL